MSARAPLAGIAVTPVVSVPLLLLALLMLAAGCGPTIPGLDWTCDFDASESRPRSDPDAAVGPDGALPSQVCQDTCGTPAKHCTATVLDGGVPGAVCPVCTF